MADRTLTLILAVAVPLLTIVYAILASALLTGVPSLGQSEATRIGTIIGVFLGSVGRALYPAIAGGVLLPKPEDLGLQT